MPNNHEYIGTCTVCGGKTYAQSECDNCVAEAEKGYLCPECEEYVDCDEQPEDCIDHVPLNCLLEMCEQLYLIKKFYGETDIEPGYDYRQSLTITHERMYRAMKRLHKALFKKKQ